MRGTKRIAMWLRALLSRRTMESELDEEMRFHLEMEATKHAQRGLNDREARRRAALAFGSMEEHKEAMREGRGVRGIEREATGKGNGQIDPDADRLVTIGHRTRGGDIPARLPNATATDVVYQASQSFDAQALYTTWQGSLTGGDGLRRARCPPPEGPRRGTASFGNRDRGRRR